MALYSGSPVNLSQITIVSRWFVIPIHRRGASFSEPILSSLPMALVAHSRTASNISFGSCSTQPSCNWIWLIWISCEQSSVKSESALKIYDKQKIDSRNDNNTQARSSNPSKGAAKQTLLHVSSFEIGK